MDENIIKKEIKRQLKLRREREESDSEGEGDEKNPGIIKIGVGEDTIKEMIEKLRKMEEAIANRPTKAFRRTTGTRKTGPRTKKPKEVDVKGEEEKNKEEPASSLELERNKERGEKKKNERGVKRIIKM